MRGFLRPGDYNSRILLMINGHRVNDGVYDSAPFGTEFPLDLDLIDHIEIVRGPSSSLFGTNAIFGLINVITRQPRSGMTVEVSGDDSSFLSRKGSLNANFREGRLSGLFSGSLYRSAGASKLFYPEYDGPQTNNGIGANVDGDRYDHAFGDLQFENLRVQGMFSTRTKLVPTGAYQANFDDPENQTTDSASYLDVSYRRTVAPGDLEMRFYFDHYDFLGQGAFGGPAPGRYVFLSSADTNRVGTEVTLGRQVGRHRIIVGTNYEYSPQVQQKNEAPGATPDLR